jgi:hypothetical protein
MHRAYAKHVELTVPSLEDWEKEWDKNPQDSVQPKLVPVDFRSPRQTSCRAAASALQPARWKREVSSRS